MSGGFGGGRIFNGPSPSSDPTIVSRIVADFVTPIVNRPRRILDVGGTAAGFRANAVLPQGTQLVSINPSGPPDADHRTFADIPAGDPGFDFAMLFGVLMYCDQADAHSLLREIRGRLRGPHATLLIAEPDPVSVAGFIDAFMKSILISPVRVLSQMSMKARFHIYSIADARKLLIDAGFGVVAQRDDLNPKFRLPVYYVLAATF